MKEKFETLLKALNNQKGKAATEWRLQNYRLQIQKEVGNIKYTYLDSEGCIHFTPSINTINKQHYTWFSDKLLDTLWKEIKSYLKEPPMFTLTKAVNAYDQEGEYLITVFKEVPTIGQIMKVLNCSKTFALFLTATGGGRKENENEWFYLKPLKSGTLYTHETL